MASLKVQLKKLEHNGNITKEQLQKLMNKLDGHDKQVKINVLNEFAEYYQSVGCTHIDDGCRLEDAFACFKCFVNRFKEETK